VTCTIVSYNFFNVVAETGFHTASNVDIQDNLYIKISGAFMILKAKHDSLPYVQL